MVGVIKKVMLAGFAGFTLAAGNSFYHNKPGNVDWAHYSGIFIADNFERASESITETGSDIHEYAEKNGHKDLEHMFGSYDRDMVRLEKIAEQNAENERNNNNSSTVYRPSNIDFSTVTSESLASTHRNGVYRTSTGISYEANDAHVFAKEILQTATFRDPSTGKVDKRAVYDAIVHGKLPISARHVLDEMPESAMKPMIASQMEPIIRLEEKIERISSIPKTPVGVAIKAGEYYYDHKSEIDQVAYSHYERHAPAVREGVNTARDTSRRVYDGSRKAFDRGKTVYDGGVDKFNNGKRKVNDFYDDKGRGYVDKTKKGFNSVKDKTKGFINRFKR
jgi:hypothetical protein